MLHFLRNLMKSKVGAALAIGFLVLIALAFASGDVANTVSFGGVAGGDRVATVGNERIDAATLNQATNSALERVKQNEPKMSMQAFLAQGGMDDVLDSLIDRLAVAAFGRERGIVASDRLIDSEITQMPIFHGPDGKFSQELFQLAIRQRGISSETLRDDIAQGLIARQVLIPASTGSTMPRKLVRRYASLLTETREGEIAVLPTVVFQPDEKPSDKQIAAYYQTHRNDFIRPERRVIRYAAFGPDVLGKVPEPTDSEIAFRYNRNKAKYAAQEKRSVTQVIVPTEAAAKVVAAEVAKGTSLEAAAKTKGLTASTLEPFTKSELSTQFSQEVADAAFAAGEGKVAAPARSALGWHVMRVAKIEKRPAQSLDQVRGDIAKEIAQEKQRVAISDALEKIESDLDGGASLAEVTKRLGIKAQSTPPVTADGRVYLKPGEQVPDALKPALETAFTMDSEEPQLAEVERGKTFVIYDVTNIAESAPAPLNEITGNVRQAYLHDKASAKAEAAARQVQKAMVGGKTMQQALSTLKTSLPPAQKITMSRPELARLQQQTRGEVPKPLALMFNMAGGTTKVQPGPGERAWFVVSLSKIEPGKVADDSKILDQARTELGTLLGREYTDALGRAIRKEIGVKRNPDAINAVRKQLGGEN